MILKYSDEGWIYFCFSICQNPGQFILLLSQKLYHQLFWKKIWLTYLQMQICGSTANQISIVKNQTNYHLFHYDKMF